MAKDIYVSTAGSDSNQGTLDSPLKTITKAATLAAPGDTIAVRGGIYSGAVAINSSGAAGAPITVSPYPGESVILSGSSQSADIVTISGNYVTLNGFEISGGSHGIVAWADHDIALLNNNVHDNWKAGIWVGSDSIGNSYNNLIQGNHVHDNVLQNSVNPGAQGWGTGLQVWMSDNARIIGNSVHQNYGEGIGDVLSSGVEISGNFVHDDFSVNIYLDNAPSAKVDSNFIYSTGDTRFFIHGHAADEILAAIESYGTRRPLSNDVITNNIDVGDRSGFYYGDYGRGGGMQNALIANNTFVNNSGEAINLDASRRHSGNHVQNNIFDRNTNGPLATGSNKAAKSDHNDWFGSLTTFAGAGDLLVNPMLVNPDGLSPEDYRLQSGSPAAAAGTTLPQVTDNFFGELRQTPYAIGAA